MNQNLRTNAWQGATQCFHLNIRCGLTEAQYVNIKLYIY
jgi:hypothetical protein